MGLREVEVIIAFGERRLEFPRRPLLMGIINVNDDSFSGDGTLEVHKSVEQAVAQARAGADVLDVGAESARTNRRAISVEEEIKRFRGFFAAWEGALEGLLPRDEVQVWPPIISVNTWRPEVVEEVLSWGVAELLNDMGGLPDSSNARVCADNGVALLIMHTVGEPKVRQEGGRWGDIVGELRSFFAGRVALACEAGLSEEAIILDPGLDFAKNRADNLEIMQNLGSLRELNRPVLLPISRKDFIGDVLGVDNPAERDGGTVACLPFGLELEAALFRVHNMEACWQALRVLYALKGGKIAP